MCSIKTTKAEKRRDKNNNKEQGQITENSKYGKY